MENVNKQEAVQPLISHSETSSAIHSTATEKERSKESPEFRTIQNLTASLPNEDRQKAETILSELDVRWASFIDTGTAFKISRFELGRVLSQLQRLFAKPGRHGLFARCLEAKNISKSTAYQLLNDYRRIKDLPNVLIEVAEKQ